MLIYTPLVKNKSRTLVFFLCLMVLPAFFMQSASISWADTETSPGAQAVRNGQALEKRIEAALVAQGFKVVSHKEWSKYPTQDSPDLLLTNVPYTSIYGSKGRTEFVLRSPRLKSDIRIEAKWQNTKGSTDQQLPYLYMNAASFSTMPEAHIMIVIDGKGWRSGALAWLRTAAQNAPEGKRIDVFNLAEFLAWSNTH